MSTITPEERPTFKVAHWYRCHGLLGRENFLAFQKTFSEIVTTIVGTKDEDELWEYIRSLFGFDDYADCVPINAANLSVLFHPVQLFLNAIALDWNRDISIQKRIKPFVHTIGIARALIAAQLKVEPELVAFVRNGSDPNAVINNGLTFQPGEEVIIWDENHPTGGESAWKIRKDRFPNINIVVVSLEGEQDPDNIVQKFLAKVNTKTKIVAFSEISHLSGILLPAKQLCAAIHKVNKKIHVHVDGAQSWGAIEHDLEDLDCDSYSGGSHKWFLGPKETGILYMRKECIENFAPKDIGYNGEMEPPPTMTGEDTLPKDASRFELVGQRNDTNLIGLLYTADLMGLIGFDRIAKRLKELTLKLERNLTKLLQELPTRIFEIETPLQTNMHHAIMVIKFQDDPPLKKHKHRGKAKAEEAAEPPLSEQLYNRLYENHKIGVSTKKGNRMRFSPHIYNTEEHMDRLVQAMKVELKCILD